MCYCFDAFRHVFQVAGTVVLSTLLLLAAPNIALAESKGAALSEISLIDDHLLLLDVRLNNDFVLSSIEAYRHNNRVLVAIEPLFDALNIRYQLYTDRLIAWKGEDEFIFAFDDAVSSNFTNAGPLNTQAIWANDGFFSFLDTATLSSFFGVRFEANLFKLRLNITTQKNGYAFPIQVLERQREQRMIAAAIQAAERQEYIPPPITIEDQYRFATIPHGRVSASMLWNNDHHDERFSVQLTSDLFWHSADLTMAKTTDQDFSSNLKLSRYKTKPDEYILGLFDNYSFGDISSSSNNLTTDGAAGLGLIFEREPEDFRRRNLAISLEETAPPGWEAELYRNNQYIETVTVPDDGQLSFDDVPTEFGQNYYQIKLYGPFGEEQIIERFLPLEANALAEGAVAYDLYALDDQHQVINDKSRNKRDLTNYGATFDIGMSDHWQLGLGFAGSNNKQSTSVNNVDRYLYSMKNAFSYPGFLIENDLAVNDQDGYAQLTSIIGRSGWNHSYALSYETAERFNSASISAPLDPLESGRASYSGTAGFWSFAFNSSYEDQGSFNQWSLSNRMSRSFDNLHFSHSISHTETKSPDPITQAPSESTQVIGAISLAGRLNPNLRLTGNLNYDPDDDDIFLDNGSLTANWSPLFFGVKNYVTARLLPFTSSNNDWSLSHRIALNARDYELTYTSSYNAIDEWSLSAGIRFFLGYDRHNHRTIMRSNTTNASATLDVHSYLDRQANGNYDVLDHHLEEVSFIGAPGWEDIESGSEGRTILPGVGTQGPFYFSAKWKEGTKTHNNDYVVFTHPGAYVSVNMPFHLSSEITGFVERAGNGAPLAKVKVRLEHLDEQRETETDPDGYFEFLDLMPGEYTIQISESFLRENGYTSDIIGYTVRSLRTGGFTELDVIELNRAYDSSARMLERVVPFQTAIDNSEKIIEHDNIEQEKHMFILPTDKPINAPHSHDQIQETEVLLNSSEELSDSNEDSQLDALETNSSTPVLIQASIPTPVKKELLPALKLPKIKPSTLNAQQHIAQDKAVRADKKLISQTSLAGKTSKQYVIQLAALSDENSAKRFINQLRYKGDKPPKLTQGLSKGNAIYRVTIGAFKNTIEAKQYATKHLAKQSFFVRPRYQNEH